jgi:hypothetical protein
MRNGGVPMLHWSNTERAFLAICGFLAGVFLVMGVRADPNETSVHLFCYGAAAVFGYAALFAKLSS